MRDRARGSSRWFVLLLGVCVAPLAVAPAWGQEDWSADGAAEFSLSMGYANVSLRHSDVIDGESAFRFEPVLSLAPLKPLPQLRVGADLGVTLVLDNTQRTVISNNGTLIVAGSSDVPLWLLEPELRLSWRQYFGESHTVFVEGGAAGGVAFGFFQLNTSQDGTGDSYDKDDSTVFGRVFLRAGARVTGGLAGIEASYLAGNKLDFGGNAAGDLTEWYVGIFGALVF